MDILAAAAAAAVAVEDRMGMRTGDTEKQEVPTQSHQSHLQEDD